jgi:hypothetical protein
VPRIQGAAFTLGLWAKMLDEATQNEASRADFGDAASLSISCFSSCCLGSVHERPG